MAIVLDYHYRKNPNQKCKCGSKAIIKGKCQRCYTLAKIKRIEKRNKFSLI